MYTYTYYVHTSGGWHLQGLRIQLHSYSINSDSSYSTNSNNSYYTNSDDRY